MRITLDKGLETERSLDFTMISEHQSEDARFNSLDATIKKTIETSSDIPDTSGFVAGMEFTSIEVTDGSQIVIPIKEYNKIASSDMRYSDKQYSFYCQFINKTTDAE